MESGLRDGVRGLAGGSSLAQLLALHRGVRNPKRLPPLSHAQILGWADAFHQRIGKWPTSYLGPVEEAPGETWCAIQLAMLRGRRGLPRLGLASLLQRERGTRNIRNLPPLSYARILAWADDWQRDTGKWPTILSGPIPQAPGEIWANVHSTMRDGLRGLPGGYSLMELLRDWRGVSNNQLFPKLTIGKILGWARQYRRSHGHWPGRHSGPISGAANPENWRAVDEALRSGRRGLPGGSSLRRLLAGQLPKNPP